MTDNEILKEAAAAGLLGCYVTRHFDITEASGEEIVGLNAYRHVPHAVAIHKIVPVLASALTPSLVHTMAQLLIDDVNKRLLVEEDTAGQRPRTGST
jgi:hypothetical protein